MNSLQIIDERKVLGKEFKIYGDFENPLFLAKDVAEWIEYDKSSVNKMLEGLDESEKLNGTIFRAGQNREVVMITEDGLYEVLMLSRKPIAKQFKKEVKKILKDIRKHGMYATDELIANPDIAIAAFTALKEERERNKRLQVENESMKPKALFADAVSASHTSILVGDMAKLLRQNGVNIGQNRFFEWLRERGFLMKSGESFNMPTQKAMDLGLFQIKERTINNPDGSIRVTKTTKVTGKGQQYFVNLFLKATVNQ